MWSTEELSVDERWERRDAKGGWEASEASSYPLLKQSSVLHPPFSQEFGKAGERHGTHAAPQTELMECNSSLSTIRMAMKKWPRDTKSKEWKSAEGLSRKYRLGPEPNGSLRPSQTEGLP